MLLAEKPSVQTAATYLECCLGLPALRRVARRDDPAAEVVRPQRRSWRSSPAGTPAGRITGRMDLEYTSP
jgi:hypothetical protein